MLADTLQPDLVLIPGLEVFAVMVVGLQALIVSGLEALTVLSVCANIVCITAELARAVCGAAGPSAKDSSKFSYFFPALFNRLTIGWRADSASPPGRARLSTVIRIELHR